VTRKFKIVVSDLHIGAGSAGSAGNYLEDFVSDEDLVRFLNDVRLESIRDQIEVELIINGDLFEFLQVPAVETFDPAQSYGQECFRDSSEASSLMRLGLIAAGHPTIFEALGDFIHVEDPKRRIAIIKGDHDVNLYWPLVKAKLREILGATGTRASALVFAEEFISREGLYIEHGHQRAEVFSHFPDFIEPRLMPEQPDKLYYPPGSTFILDFLNEVERQHWWVDTVKPMTGLVWCSLFADFALGAEVLSAMANYLVPSISAAGTTPESGQKAAQPEFLQEFASGGAGSATAERYRSDPEFRLNLHRQIQAWLADAALTAPTQVQRAVEVHDSALIMAAVDQQAWQTALRRAAQEVAVRESARVVLLGHIHAPEWQELSDSALYINTGTWLWQEELSPGVNGQRAPVFSRLHQVVKPYRLPYARIDYDEEGIVNARLLDFAAHGKRGRSSLAAPSAWVAALRSWLAPRFGSGR
jgi:UDP-2,3-diacylglucosamine pyrophosphatase LpxH